MAEKTEKIVTLTASVPLALTKALRKVADGNERSVSAEVRIALRNHVAAAADATPERPAA